MSSGIDYTIHPKNDDGFLSDAIMNGDSSQHYVSVFPKESNIYGSHWELTAINKEGLFNIVNPDAFLYIPSRDGSGYGTFKKRVMQIANNSNAQLSVYEEKDSEIKKLQSFVIELVKPVSISNIEYLVDEDKYRDKIKVERIEDEIVSRSYTNETNFHFERMVEFENVKLKGESNFEEYRGIFFNITDLKSTLIKTPEVMKGKLQKVLSENYEPSSFYKPYQIVERKVENLSFKFDMPPKSKMIVTYKIPKYSVTCPYKLTLKLNDENMFVEVYGHWKGIVYSTVEVGEPTIETDTINARDRSNAKFYKLSMETIKKGGLINMSNLKPINRHE